MSNKTIHELKTDILFYGAVACGNKTFEIRKDDRNFQVGDILHLQEYRPLEGKYTGNSLKMVITYILSYAPYYGLKPGYVIMGIKPYKEEN